MSIQFKLPVEGKPDKPLEQFAYAFNRNRELVEKVPVKEDSFTLKSFDEKNFNDLQLIIAPEFTERKIIQPKDILKHGYEPQLPQRWDKNIELLPIPEQIWRHWFPCFCRVRGKVMNTHCSPATPVYKARVHVCEVDPIFLVLQKLPDLEIIKIRDWIYQHMAIPEKWKGIYFPPRITPDPPPFEKFGKTDKLIQPPFIRTQFKALSNNLIADGTEPSISVSASLTNAKDVLRPIRSLQLNAEEVLPSLNRDYFFSSNSALVRDYLTANYKIIFWPLCRWLSWLYTCAEVAVIETDIQGVFDRYFRYPCNDQPDLYFWVEYCINGVWTTVYSPWIGCSTRWDYVCGTNVTINISDPRVPCTVPQPNIGNKDVFVFSIGNNVSVTKVQQDGSNRGLTLAGTPFEEGSPFGGNLEPHVYFGRFFANASDGGNNYFYKWSYRREGTVVWNEVLSETFRHYVKELPDKTIFPTYKIGPNADALYEILRFHTPTNDDLWVVDSRTDTASTYFKTQDLGNFNLTDGVYELKMELYKYVGVMAQRVNWDAEAINLLVPDHDLSSPFGDVEVDPEADNIIVDKYKYKEAGVLFGFTMKVFVDNMAPLLSLQDVGITNADATTGVAGPCGFIQFNNRLTSTLNFQFHASQQNNFASFGFGISKGNGSESFSSGGKCGIASALLIKSPGGATGSSIALNGSGDYELHVTPDLLLGTCDKAAFTQSASIHPMVQDGWSHLYNNSTLSTAFALEEKLP
jgi:hypothetical protein